MLLELIFALQSAAAVPPARVERQLAAMGTTLSLSVVCESRAAALEASEAALRALERVERRLSTWNVDSELARLCDAPVGQPVEISRELGRDLLACRSWWRETSGAFDPSLGPLVVAWDLRGAGRIPSEPELERSLEAVGLERAWSFEPHGATRRVAGARLEEGAFGKGIGLDEAAAELVRAGACGSLDFGGQVCVVGESTRWAVADPRDRSRPVLVWTLDAGSIATTANSERAREVNGVRIGHVLDPRSGRPAPDFGSVSVACASAARADAWSTAAFVLGPDQALLRVAEQQGLALLCIEPISGGLRVRATADLRGRIEVVADGVRLEFVDPRPNEAREPRRDDR